MPSLAVLAPDDLDVPVAHALWRLRQEVFVVEQACAYPDLDGRDLEPGTRHALLLDDEDDGSGAVLGCARLLDDATPDGPVWRIGRVALAPSARGRGLADGLVRAALDAVAALDPDRDVVLDAQSPLARWYAGFGFEVSGPEFVEDGIPHVPMRRAAPVS